MGTTTSLDAERAVLGAILLRNSSLAVAAEILETTDFSDRAHRTIYEIMLDLAAADSPIEPVVIKDRLVVAGDLEKVGGVAYLSELMDATPTSANVEQHAKLVREKALLRGVWTAGETAAARAMTGEDEAAELIAEIESKTADLAGRIAAADVLPASKVALETMAELEEIAAAPERALGVPTGFADVDAITAGLHGTDLVIVAARPSMGKTAFAGNVALHAAERGRKVFFSSLEMSRKQLMRRWLSSVSGVPHWRLKRAELSSEEWRTLTVAASEFEGLPLWIDETSGVSPFVVKAKLRRHQMKHGLDLAVIDYVQLMSGAGKRYERDELKYDEIAKALKGLAKTLNIPVVLVCQLNRDLEKRGDKRPMLSDLRNSGAIEMHADVVIFPWRPEVYAKNQRKYQEVTIGGVRLPSEGLAEIVVAKQRNGPTGSCWLRWDKEHVSFQDLAIDDWKYRANWARSRDDEEEDWMGD